MVAIVLCMAFTVFTLKKLRQRVKEMQSVGQYEQQDATYSVFSLLLLRVATIMLGLIIFQQFITFMQLGLFHKYQKVFMSEDMRNCKEVEYHFNKQRILSYIGNIIIISTRMCLLGIYFI